MENLPMAPVCQEKDRLIALYRALHSDDSALRGHAETELEAERTWDALEQHILGHCADCEHHWRVREWIGSLPNSGGEV
jgi:hypothetical protein